MIWVFLKPFGIRIAHLVRTLRIRPIHESEIFCGDSERHAALKNSGPAKLPSAYGCFRGAIDVAGEPLAAANRKRPDKANVQALSNILVAACVVSIPIVNILYANPSCRVPPDRGGPRFYIHPLRIGVGSE